VFSVRYLLRPKTLFFIQSVSLIASRSFMTYVLGNARWVGRVLRHLFWAAALNDRSAVLWFTQRQKVVCAFEKCLPLNCVLTNTSAKYVSCRKKCRPKYCEKCPASTALYKNDIQNGEKIQSYVPCWRKIRKLACFLVDTMFTSNRNVKQPKHTANKAYPLTTNSEHLYLQSRIANRSGINLSNFWSYLTVH
jgi:hypothetical protein